MNESKIELTERWRREGRWSEASRFKDAAVKDFRSQGMKRAEASDAAWEATAEAFPPPAPTEQPPDLGCQTMEEAGDWPNGPDGLLDWLL
ncbi:MAG: hypothetical protein KKE86_14450, partial [Planctomycetes bacterium]|nr:hypothetical protein [Planctomycetota bacterium]